MSKGFLNLKNKTGWLIGTSITLLVFSSLFLTDYFLKHENKTIQTAVISRDSSAETIQGLFNAKSND